MSATPSLDPAWPPEPGPAATNATGERAKPTPPASSSPGSSFAASVTSVGLRPFSIVSLVTTHFFTSRREGSSNWTSSRVSSRIERRPRAPVSRSIALSAIECERVVGEHELDPVELEEALELLDERVARLGEDRDQVLALRAGGSPRCTGRRPMNSGISPYSTRSSGQHLLERSPVSLSSSSVTSAPKPTPLWPMRRSIDLVEVRERAAADEQDVRGVDREELLVRVLAPALRRHRRHGSLEDLQQRLLDALARHVARDRRVVRLARDLVDLVDVDDPGLGLLHVEVGGLDQLEEDVLDVLADVAGLGERRGVGDRERDVQDLRQRLGEQRLAAAGRAEQQDVRLLQLEVVRPRTASSARACSGCRPRPRACAWRAPGRRRTPGGPSRSPSASAGSRGRRSREPVSSSSMISLQRSMHSSQM